MTIRVRDGQRGRIPAIASAGLGSCVWCPGQATPATEFGTLDGRAVVSGCRWHMRLFVQRGELRAIYPSPKASQRRRG